MKKLLVLTLSLVLVMAFALPANAAIQNTVHDFQSNRAGTQTGFGIGGNRGMCSYCHIPHSSKGDRLWPSTGSSSQAIAGLVGQLCASCHVGTSMENLNTTIKDLDRSSDIFFTGLINHILIDDGVYGNDTNQTAVGAASTQFNQTNTWPYCVTEGTTGGGEEKIECTSCHNPHNDEPLGGQSAEGTEANSMLGRGNDYLRAAMYNTANGIAFCEYCHEEKTRSGPAANVKGTGTHPVGATANAGDTAQADIHIESAERVILAAGTINQVSSNFYDMGIDTQEIGGIGGDHGPGTHLTSYDTGGVTCQTCHKVHGAPKGANNTWAVTGSVGSYLVGSPIYLSASDDGYANILAIENDANGGTNGYLYQSEGRASVGDYNDLCIDCHETTPSVGPNALAAYASASLYANSTVGDENSGGAYPTDAHPVNLAPDGKSEVGFDLTVKDPGWTDAARWAGLHGGSGTARWDQSGTEVYTATNLSSAGRWDGDATVTTSEVVCLTCHSIHDGDNGSPILRDASLTFCNDCHSESLGRVSHPVGNGSSMWDNPDATTWPNGDGLPLANYYQAAGGLTAFDPTVNSTTDMGCYTCHAAHDGVDGFMLRVPDDNSRICVGCHTSFVAAGDENPANYIAEYGEGVTERQGSHYTGTIADTGTRTGETRWAYSGDWTATAYDGATAQTSHWNGGVVGSRLQCQSCHTPHNAAYGLVEANTYDGNTTGFTIGDWYHPSETGATGEPGTGGATNFSAGGPMCNTPTSALLLGNNKRSSICVTCHWPSGTHVTTIWTIAAKPDPQRAGGDQRRYRDYTTRTEKFIISILHANQEVIYNVYDLIADLDGDGSTPESPTNFPPLFVNVQPTNSVGEMVCDSCHAPHGAISGTGAFIMEAGKGDGNTLNLSRQRVANRNFDDLCWKCHDK